MTEPLKTSQNRWLIVVASALALMVGQGSINVFAAGVFLKPVSADLGFGRGEISTAIGISNLMIAAATPFFGRLIDRKGVRRPLLLTITLFALATAAMSLLPASVGALFAFYAIAGLVGVGHNPGAYSKAISEWFDRDRGLALGIALAGVGLGTALIPILSAFLIANFGWRLGYVGLGITIVVIAFIPVFLFVREPADLSGKRGTEAVTLVGMLVPEAIRTWRFWAMAVTFFIGGLTINGSLIHIIPLLTDRGLAVPAAVAAVSSAGLALIVGRLISGYLMDKIFAPYIGIFFLVLPLIGLIILGSGTELVSPIVGAIFLGLGIGAEIDLMSFLVGRYFGIRSFGALHGMLFTGLVLGNAAGASVLGWVFQKMGSYGPAFLVFDGLLALACVLFAMLGPYKYPAEHV